MGIVSEGIRDQTLQAGSVAIFDGALQDGLHGGSVLDSRPARRQDRRRTPMRPLREALLDHFGHADFRPGQEEVVQSVLAGRPTLAVLPTGAGKSLCYQLPAILAPGTALIVSPLIALMKDQVDSLRERGIAAGKLTSADDPEERRATYSALLAGELKLLYVAPERLSRPDFREVLGRIPLSLLAVDEAHCVSQWGHDFRPDYLAIREVVQSLQPPRLAAFTATATPEVREEIGTALGMHDPALFVRGFRRPDLRLEVRRARTEDERQLELRELIENRRQGRPALVYAATRKQTEESAAALRAAGLRAAHYHAGCEAEQRAQVQEDFLADKLDVLVATNAFGMGIDKPDIRLLIHAAMPSSVESYYQEVGRAGRDGQGAEAILLARPKDARTAEFLITEGNPDGEQSTHVQLALRRLSRMQRFVNGPTCRHRSVLEYFGDPDASELMSGCDACDRCDAETRAEYQDLSEPRQLIVRKALAGVARTHERYGRGRVAEMLAGSQSAALKKSGLDRLTTFGLLEKQGKAFVLELLDCLEESGLIRTVGTQYPLLGLTEAGNEVMQDRDRACMRWPQGARAGSSARRRGGAPAALPEGFDSALYNRLVVWRAEVAKLNARPAYTVFHDRSLKEIAALAPTELDTLALVNGIGPAKLEVYGPSLLALVRDEEAVVPQL